jgi:single-strand DNA-binding protein
MINQVILLGNVGKEPEAKDISSGLLVSFSVATDRSNRKDGEWGRTTDWTRVVAFGELAGRVQEQLRKGDQVYVEGRIQTRSWTGNDGRKNYITEVVAKEIKLLYSRRSTLPSNKGEAGEQAR